MPKGASHKVTPALVVSGPPDGSSKRKTKTIVRQSGPAGVHRKEPSSEDWSDVDDTPPRRRRKTRRPASSHSGSSTASSRGYIQQPKARVSRSGFLPSLSRILEVNSSTTSVRPSTRGSDRIHRPERKTRRRAVRTEDTFHRQRWSKGHDSQTGRDHALAKINPSLLSVLSSLTGSSDGSSNSSSTITQQSYYRRSSTQLAPTRKQQQMEAEVKSTISSQLPNVFDFMEIQSYNNDHDTKSVASSSSSYQASDADSSVAPDTPSSQSTFPSPTATKFQSVADLPKKYDAPTQCGSVSSGRSYSNSPAPSIRSLRRQPTVSDVPEDDEEEQDNLPPMAPAEVDCDFQRPSSRLSRRHSRSSDRSRQREESMRRQSFNNQQGHYVEPVYGQHRSYSASSAHSDRSTYFPNTAIQQYHWPSPPSPNNHVDRPPVPDAPDLTRRTLIGYEQLALELASTTSPVQPVYRKFEYLNHRILLHLQDELCELEEHLRILDEIIAQMEPESAKSPVSRRSDNVYGTELHLRRRDLLGNIFMKTEQYNRAMTAYTSLTKTSVSASDDQVASYREWMSKYAPVHEVETRFLLQQEDLVAPGRAQVAVEPSTRHHPLLVALMLPLLLFSIVPTLAGRLLVTVLVAMGVFLVAGTTRFRHMMGVRDWAVCGAAYLLLMAAIGGCVPTHDT